MNDRVVYITGDDGSPISVSLGEVLYNDKLTGSCTKYYDSLDEYYEG